MFHHYIHRLTCKYFYHHSATIYVQVEKKDIISSANKGAVSASLIALYISSIIFLLLGVAGLAGSIKSSKNK
jgi:hypothetical protein